MGVLVVHGCAAERGRANHQRRAGHGRSRTAVGARSALTVTRAVHGARARSSRTQPCVIPARPCSRCVPAHRCHPHPVRCAPRRVALARVYRDIRKGARRALASKPRIDANSGCAAAAACTRRGQPRRKSLPTRGNQRGMPTGTRLAALCCVIATLHTVTQQHMARDMTFPGTDRRRTDRT